MPARNAGGVRGCYGCSDSLKHSIQILKHFVVPEAQYPEAIRREPLISANITRRACMLAAIDLDHEFGFIAGEVSYEWTDWDLPTEFRSRESAITQGKPELPLGIAHRTTQYPSARSPLTRRASRATLSHKGRGFA
jgi:hypothetical protein